MQYSSLVIRELDKKDYTKAIQFAIQGMHFDRYMKSPFLLQLYGRYFLYLELNRATQILAAYDGEELVGLLLAELYDEQQKQQSKGQRFYVALFQKLQTIYAEDADAYDKINEVLYQRYRQTYQPDGELIFLAANPDRNRKGVGSALLAELERRACGKELFLYTDNNCTYQFYEHRGFERAEEEEIQMNLPDGVVPLSCYLYRKKLGDPLTQL